eukprot:TRINITY_DN15015_c0_g1_i9.p1 TRINITY_DN15015_c0_g1~~TRINITY_DN15015_c0_g1_i9.p1  ORF type:complete len:359 (-),score=65.36 TRINITY_DN15015_c0_g1_i9:353-1429(-)
MCAAMGWTSAASWKQRAALLWLGCIGYAHAAIDLQEEVRRQLLEASPILLRGGDTMPPIALGTSMLSGSGCSEAVDYALRSGYRSIDTAIVYDNHAAVGEGIRRSGVRREEVFLISKIPPALGGLAGVPAAVEQMLAELQTPYVDLCLVHYPGARFSFEGMMVNKHISTDAALIVERAMTWRRLEEAQEQGKCRYIGVSNFLPDHLSELLDYARIAPAVNQIEYHPYFLDDSTIDFCRRHGIAVQVYGSINAKGLLDDPTVAAVAGELGRTPAQVLLRWAAQRGVMVLPKTGNKDRILANAKLWDFSLSSAQWQRIARLDKRTRSYLAPEEVPTGRYRKQRRWHAWKGFRNVTRSIGE